MAVKLIFLVCSSLLVQSTTFLAISGQCVRNNVITGGCGPQLANNGGLGLAGLNSGYASLGNTASLNGGQLGGCNAGYGSGNGYAANLGNLASLSGGELLVSSSCALAPSGLSVVSENTLEGVLNVIGALPFLSAVALEGQVPSGGSAGVSYSCGNGNVGIVGVNGGAAAGGLSLGSAGLASGLSYGNAGLANAGLANYGLANAGLANYGLANAGLANYGLANAGLASCGLGNAGIPEGIVTIGTGCGGLYY